MTGVRIRRALCAAAIATTLGGGFALATSSCAQTPQEVPVRTFERADKLDVVCLRVRERTNGPDIAPTPVDPALCAPVPPRTDGSALPYHLYALVTQTARGELAVVDLTAGRVIDTNRALPGINFIPVGQMPTDVAVSPSGDLAFVAAGEPARRAIYAIPSSRLLGDSQSIPRQVLPTPKLTDWRVCSLPETAVSVQAVPRPRTDDSSDVQAGPYDLVAVLGSDGRTPSRVAMIDPAIFGDGGIAPGTLEPCPIRVALELASAPAVAWRPGPTWGEALDDVPTNPTPPLPPTGECSSGLPDAGAPTTDGGDDAGGSTGGADAAPAQDDGRGGIAGGPYALPTDRGTPRAGAVVRDGSILYIADRTQPIIHTVDLRDPDAPRELAPLLVTSVLEPARPVVVGGLAVSPPTRDYRRYLYAIDQRQGGLIVYDVTELPTEPRVPLTRPRPELNPFQAPDRITFNAPVASVAFVRHDFPLTQNADRTPRAAAITGAICNPNPNAGDGTGTVLDNGVYYRANEDILGTDPARWPTRLRGVFAFATLTNGQVVTVDVDDWDAPCRRPDPIRPLSLEDVGDGGAPPPGDADAGASDAAVGGNTPADELLRQPNDAVFGMVRPSSASDLSPYRAPFAFTGSGRPGSPVTLEAFFPAVAPHRPRSATLLRRDARGGTAVPELTGPPQLVFQNATVPTRGPEAPNYPSLVPAPAPLLVDPSNVVNPNEPNYLARTLRGSEADRSRPGQDPGVRFSFEDPLVHIGQDWAVTFEGALPGFDGVPGKLVPIEGHSALALTNDTGLFCRRGVEDARLGAARARAAASALRQASLPLPAELGARLGDYVQVADELAPSDDPYWSLPDGSDGDACWNLDERVDLSGDGRARERYDICANTFGRADEQSPLRDFPILEAYEDRLVLGRFGYPQGATPTTQNRLMVSRDPSNAPFLKLLRCCFRKQVRFRVRTGGEWLVLGSISSYLHHVVTDPTTRACVQSCKREDGLLNGRALEIVPPTTPVSAALPDRNSPVAFRNPMFSFLLWRAVNVPTGVFTPSARGLSWRFSTRGQFRTLSLPLSAQTTALSPQSMRFISSLGQLAVIDAATQGLVLIDLSTVGFARPPLF